MDLSLNTTQARLAYEAEKAHNRWLLEKEQAHRLRDIKPLLRHYFRFKLYVKFKKQKGQEPVSRHFYGNEHRCTYKQLLTGHISEIVLRPAEGYRLLDDWARRNAARYQSAKIYMRNPESGGFDALCREYYGGVVHDHHVPVLSDDEMVVVPYTITDGRLQIGAAGDPLPDFKSIVAGAVS